MKNWFMQNLQKALNRYLALDPESKNRLALLHGKSVQLEITGMNLQFQLQFADDKILCTDNLTTPAHTHIQSTPLSLLRMINAEGDRTQFFAGDVHISGDLELAQQMVDVFDELEIDWEEYLSRWIGDVPAHQMKNLSRQLKHFHQRFSDILSQNINEYVHEEINLFPPAEALQDFFTEVDELRMDVDRVAQRIERLKEK